MIVIRMMSKSKHARKLTTWAALMTLSTFASVQRADGELTFTVSDAASWPSQAHHDAAVNAIQLVVNRYNAYGNFGNHNVYVFYNAGIPTAQASYLGSIGFGGTYPNERVTQHEMAHYLGLPSSGWNALMVGGVWRGAISDQLVRQFDGEEAELHGDSIHFWPYGLNYDSEGSALNKQRQVAMVYGMRGDLGIGSANHPSAAATVTATGNDPSGESGFNYSSRWSDGYAPHAGADYFTGDHALRTPASANSFTFYGDSLTVNNTTLDRGLSYKGQGTSGTITIDNLILDGGWIYHLATVADRFELDGNLNVVTDSNLCAKQGNIDIVADVTGSGNLTIHPTDSPEQDNRYVTFSAWNNSFSGDIVNNARFELAGGANFMFVIGAAGVNNAIAGPAAQATVINGAFEFDLSGASTTVGDSWALVTAANTRYGAAFEITGFSQIGDVWRNDIYEFDQATGVLTVIPPTTAWSVDGSGFWSVPGNWTGGVPGIDDDAVLGSILTAPQAPAIIDLDMPATLNRLMFDSPHPYILSGVNTLTLTNLAEIVATQGVHEVAVTVGGTAGLTVLGSGSVVLSGANTYMGDTNIHHSTLALAGTATISNTANINIKPGATFDVSGLDNPFELGHGQTLNNNGDIPVIGNVIASSGSTVTGTGTFAGDFTAGSGSLVRVGGAGLSDLTPVAGQVTYIDATTGPRGNTTLTNGAAFYPRPEGTTGPDNDWEKRTLGNGASTIESGGETSEDAYEIKTRLLWLNPWEVYEIYAFFWDSTSTTEDWNIRAGFTSRPGSNTLFSAADATDQLGGATAAPLASTLAYRISPLLSEGNRALHAALVGTVAADDGGTIEVYIDDMPSTIGANRRTLYDGLGVSQVGPLALSASGDFTMAAGATLEIDVLTETVHDMLEVGGHFHAAGTLEVIFGPSAPTPQPGDAFDIIDAASISGSFDLVVIDALQPGHAWDLRELYTTGVISIVDARAMLEDCVTCLTGPGGSPSPGCASRDQDADGDIDMYDYAATEACVSNGSGMVLPGCLAD